MAHDVFISYASQDKVIADGVCAKLESRHLRCWIAPRDIIAGMSYADAIIGALTSCRIVVVLLSAESIASPHVAIGEGFARLHGDLPQVQAAQRFHGGLDVVFLAHTHATAGQDQVVVATCLAQGFDAAQHETQ